MDLTISLFFDGTCNNKHDQADKMTNVGKLFDIHTGVDIALLVENNSTQEPKKLGVQGNSEANEFKLYIRGVGTKKIKQDLDWLDDDWYENIVFGSAFGAGGHDRIRYASKRVSQLTEYIQSQIGEETSKPTTYKITWNVFGFSRGAALARHFINQIVEGKLENLFHNKPRPGTPLINTSVQHEIHFAGLFDTVGSFGIPGNDINPFHCDIDNQKVKFIAHMCSDDELRATFDLLSIMPSDCEDTDTFNDFSTVLCAPENIAGIQKHTKDLSCWKIEESYPGVHADIGGGYGEAFEQGLANNQLSRIYLRKMHALALSVGVSFFSAEKAEEMYPEHWILPKELVTSFMSLMQDYKKHPNLSKHHLFFRNCQRYREVADYDFKMENFRFSDYSSKRRKFLREFDRYRIQIVEELLIEDCFEDEAQAEEFLKNYDNFRERYIHVSHFPANGTPGMEAQKAPIDMDAWPVKQLAREGFLMGLPWVLQRKVYKQSTRARKMSQPNSS